MTFPLLQELLETKGRGPGGTEHDKPESSVINRMKKEIKKHGYSDADLEDMSFADIESIYLDELGLPDFRTNESMGPMGGDVRNHRGSQSDEDEDDDGSKSGPIEAHGVKGMKNTPWRKTFKSRKALNDWVDKMDGDVEVYGTRDAD